MDSIFIEHKHNNLMKYQTLIRTTATIYLLIAVLGCTGTKESKEGFLHVDKKVISVVKTATESRFTVSSTEYWQLSKPNTGAKWITNIAADNGTSDDSSITGENDAFITITTTANPSNAERSTKLTLRAIDQAGKALTYPTPVTISFTQVPTTHTGDVSVTTQAEVDALRTSLTAGATRIVGNVTIGSESRANDISDLSPFAAITEITGNVVVRHNPRLPNLMGLNQLQSIGGSFEVGGYDEGNASLTSLGDFSALQSIGDLFWVGGNASLTSLGNFSALQSIGANFEVGGFYRTVRDQFDAGNASLTSLGDFTALQTIGGVFGVSSNNALTSLGDFSSLQTIGGGFEVGGGYGEGNASLTSLGDFTALQTIGGSFDVNRNATLTSLGDFSALQYIGGRFGVGDSGGGGNVALTSLGDFSALQSIGDGFWVGGNTSLPSMGGFPMLTSIGDQHDVSIVVARNNRLQDCCVLTEFLRGTTNIVSGRIRIYDNAPGCNSTTQVNCDPFLQAGQKVVFAAKTATEGTLDLFSTLRWQLSKPNTGAEWITNIAAGNGTSNASSITRENDASITITTTANPNDAGRSTTLMLRAIDQAGNALTDPASITISFTQLGTTHTGDVSVTTQAEVDALRTSLTTGAARIVGNVTIGPKEGMSDISDLSPFAAITELTGNVIVRRNPRLPNLMGLNQLQSIGGSFEVLENATLTSLGDFPALQTIGRGFSVSSNVALTSLGDFPALQTIGSWYFSVSGNVALTSLGDFPALQTIGGSFKVFWNDSLTSLGDFSALQSIRNHFQVRNNVVLTSQGDFPALESISGRFEVLSNAALTSSGDFPALQFIGSSFEVSSNAALTSLGDFSTLQSISSGFEVSNNDVLTSLGEFSMLASIGRDFEVSSNAALISLGRFPMLEQDGVSIVVKENGRLQDCCVLTAFLRGGTNVVFRKVIIKENATGCSSEAEIKPCAGGGSTTKGK